MIFTLSMCSNNEPKPNTKIPEPEEQAMVLSAVEEGKELYLSYCPMCHGENGQGGGALVSKLQQTPPDLRTIALRRDGFPTELIPEIVKGAENVPGHSTGDMPAWFETFRES